MTSGTAADADADADAEDAEAEEEAAGADVEDELDEHPATARTDRATAPDRPAIKRTRVR
jgi:hypothetical protein